MRYFAYGSNLDWAQMRRRCPSARFVCVALLPEHRLAFTRASEARRGGVADVVPAAAQAVWGVIYDLDAADVPRLDAAEGYAPGRPVNSYVRRSGVVLADGDPGRPLAVALYKAVPQDDPPLPHPAYKRLIVEGARHWGLPLEYVAALERMPVVS